MKQPNSSNYILQAKSDKFHWEGDGQLSIKTFTNGKHSTKQAEVISA